MSLGVGYITVQVLRSVLLQPLDPTFPTYVCPVGFCSRKLVRRNTSTKLGFIRVFHSCRVARTLPMMFEQAGEGCLGLLVGAVLKGKSFFNDTKLS